MLYPQYKEEALGKDSTSNPSPMLPSSLEASLRNQTMKKESFTIINQIGEPSKNPSGLEMKLGSVRNKDTDAHRCSGGVCEVNWKPSRPGKNDKVKQ